MCGRSVGFGRDEKDGNSNVINYISSRTYHANGVSCQRHFSENIKKRKKEKKTFPHKAIPGADVWVWASEWRINTRNRGIRWTFYARKGCTHQRCIFNAEKVIHGYFRLPRHPKMRNGSANNCFPTRFHFVSVIIAIVCLGIIRGHISWPQRQRSTTTARLPKLIASRSADEIDDDLIFADKCASQNHNNFLGKFHSIPFA